MLEPRVLESGTHYLVAGVSKMLKRLIGEDIDLAAKSVADLGSVRADPGELEQVLMNLVVNARDAMPDGGKITIETANIELAIRASQHETQTSPSAAGAIHMLTAVSDTSRKGWMQSDDGQDLY